MDEGSDLKIGLFSENLFIILKICFIFIIILLIIIYLSIWK